MAVSIINYTASVPESIFEGTPPVTIPQVPIQLLLADLGIYHTANANVLLSADVGVWNQGPLFNNALQLHIYRDGQEIFNTQLGTQTVGATSRYFYNVAFSTTDENVPTGFHIYQLTVASIIQTAQSSVTQVGPITFSGLSISPP
jgi:hypothetical protein